MYNTLAWPCRKPGNSSPTLSLFLIPRAFDSRPTDRRPLEPSHSSPRSADSYASLFSSFLIVADRLSTAIVSNILVSKPAESDRLAPQHVVSARSHFENVASALPSFSPLIANSHVDLKMNGFMDAEVKLYLNRLSNTFSRTTGGYLASARKTASGDGKIGRGRLRPKPRPRPHNLETIGATVPSERLRRPSFRYRIPTGSSSAPFRRKVLLIKIVVVHAVLGDGQSDCIGGPYSMRGHVHVDHTLLRYFIFLTLLRYVVQESARRSFLTGDNCPWRR